MTIGYLPRAVLQRVREVIQEALEGTLRLGPSARREVAAGLEEMAGELRELSEGKFDSWDQLFREDLGGADLRVVDPDDQRRS